MELKNLLNFSATPEISLKYQNLVTEMRKWCWGKDFSWIQYLERGKNNLECKNGRRIDLINSSTKKSSTKVPRLEQFLFILNVHTITIQWIVSHI